MALGGLGPQALPPLEGSLPGVALAGLLGIGLTILLQASSATLALVLTAVAGGMVPVEVGAGMVVGANVGTTLTGILAAIGATSNARRLAAAHVLFNVVTAVVALAVLSPLLQLIHAMGVWLTGSGDAVTQLVLFHTLFNLLGVLLMWPLSGPLVRFLQARFTSADDDAARPRYLDRNVAAVPVLALQALRLELARLGHLAMQLAREATRLNPVALPWSAPVPQADARLAHQLQAVEQLQLQIGKFVSETSRGAMHQEVAAQLPELLRIATHFDTLARVMHHVGVQGNHTPRVEEPPGLSLLILPGVPERPAAEANPPGADIVACVVPVFTAAEAFFSSADPEEPRQGAGGEWLLSEARAAFEEVYQTAKAALLHAGAGGGVDVNAVYGWLSRLSDLRRAVEQGYKAIQRLAALPELSALAEGGPPDMESAE